MSTSLVMQAPPAYETGSYSTEGLPSIGQPIPLAIAQPAQVIEQVIAKPLPQSNQYAFVPQVNIDRFRTICAQNEINDWFALKLRQLEGFEIVIIADDSGSMSMPIQGAGYYQANQTVSQAAFAPTYRRWDELKSCVSLIVDIASCFDADGVDIFFFNRAGLLNVTDPSQIVAAFQAPPAGATPINQTLVNVLHQKLAIMAEKKLLVLIMTDGEPTDAMGRPNVDELELTLRQRHPQSHITFVACTDDATVMQYLNGWDESIPRLDVIDDYMSEKGEILAVQGQNFRFSHGDWIVKALLGSIDPQLDALDERRPAHLPPPGRPEDCCVIS